LRKNTLDHKNATTLELAILARLRELQSTHQNGWKIVERNGEYKRLLDLLNSLKDEKNDLAHIRLKIESLLG